MPAKSNRGYFARVWAVVRRIPRGRVTSYGEVARAAGFPGAARQVAWALRGAPRSAGLPWHRVLGAGGKILLPGESGLEQRLRLEAEGVRFVGGRARMERGEGKMRGKRQRTKVRTQKLVATVLLLAALPLAAQSTSKRKLGVPEPPKKDVPYIMHADQLIETESGEAKEETRKDEQLYWIPGAASGVKTPLAGPEFLLLSDAISPDRLQLYKLETKNGRREVVTMRKKKQVARPARLSVFRIQERLFKIRVDDSLTPGEYSLSPDGSNAVFCFAVE